jgi:FAD dependent oxidoreductase TIGR03364
MSGSVGRADTAIVGAGIVGLAHAYLAAKRGKSVVVFERMPMAAGATVRNFGLVWPIGQPPGDLLHLALRSRMLWWEFLEASRLPYSSSGSLHLTYHADEENLAREFAETAPAHGYSCRWLDRGGVLNVSPAAAPDGLRGALYSDTEMTVDPRLVASQLPRYLEERYQVRFRYADPVRAIELPRVESARGSWEVDEVYVCSGDDFETLYPECLSDQQLTRCKLQMMRTAPQPEGWALGPALAGGLTMRFYSSFRGCASFAPLARRFAEQMPDYERWGIHVMASQTPLGEITLGDSHEYGRPVDIFDKPEIDELILSYLRRMARLPNPAIAERWHGVYAKHVAKPFVLLDPAPGVKVMTGLGGAGMTLSFGLAERVIQGGI